MNKTSIEWTDYTWNPVTGCTKVSQGCKNCYAETMTTRFAKTWGVESFRQVVCHQDRLMEPLYMADKLNGKKVFVCDMSDLFHEDVPDYFICEVFESIWNRPDTIFQVLTKRPERAAAIMQEVSDRILVELPFKNVWFGVSVEDQATADQRIPHLLNVPAVLRFLSCEPLLGPINLKEICHDDFLVTDALPSHKAFTGVDWVICGGESGHKARPMHPDWARSLRDQCTAAGVPFFFKQWGEWAPNIPDGKSRLAKGAHHNGTIGSAFISEGAKEILAKVGKSKSGNFLDGKQHLEFPAIKSKSIAYEGDQGATMGTSY